ncbi:MAG: toprim domain-containing protein, partial [Pseudomonadota bacterium]
VAEGYMDVIALVAAGFEAAVAPLGTAVTEDQLRLLWRMADEPVIALDGDAAGMRAAMRLVDVAMPLLAPGKTLRFAVMPAGQDPDDLIGAGGAEAMQAVLDRARPLIDLLWQRETEGKTFDSPERRAALETALDRAVSRIEDTTVRQHYARALKDLRWEFFRPAPRRRRGTSPESAPRAETSGSALATVAPSDWALRGPLILSALARYPSLIDRFEAELERLEPETADHDRILALMLATEPRDATALRQALDDENLLETLENLASLGHVALQTWMRGPPDLPTAEMCVSEELAKLAARRGIAHELAEGGTELAGGGAHAHLAWRIEQAVRTRLDAERADGVGGDSDASRHDRDRQRFLRALQSAGKKEKRP